MSGYLLDTHVLIWAGVGSDQLSASGRALLESPDSDLRFSVVSIWEVVIKAQLGRSDFRVDPEALHNYARLAGMPELPVLGEHVLGLGLLPRLHNDPFDRLLVAQARAEQLTLLTADSKVLAYGDGIQRI